ncbi:MAG: hypothetical protein EON92_03485 [Burkholderiales bacterium]|nr:MAG: hypothetical protein EON92_03485 [Burkholderiales bacterium]
MTTQTYASVFEHTSDATFRAWGSELGTNLAAAGLVKTADTGQINWLTATRPASAGTAGGYEIWRFADSSLYLKIEYGTGGSALFPQMWLTVGTGSNGAGTLTGPQSTRGTVLNGTQPTSYAIAYSTYICRTADALAVCFKMGSQSAVYPAGAFIVGKSVDAAGASDGAGYAVWRYGASTVHTLQSVRISGAAFVGNAADLFTSIPGAPTNSLNGGNIQVYPMWMNLPEMRVFAFGVAYLVSEIAKLNTAPGVAMIGSVNHTYLALGQIASSSFGGYTPSTYSLAMIWE